MKSWSTQMAGERGPLGPTDLLTLPGEDWSPLGKRLKEEKLEIGIE